MPKNDVAQHDGRTMALSHQIRVLPGQLLAVGGGFVHWPRGADIRAGQSAGRGRDLAEGIRDRDEAKIRKDIIHDRAALRIELMLEHSDLIQGIHHT